MALSTDMSTWQLIKREHMHSCELQTVCDSRAGQSLPSRAACWEVCIQCSSAPASWPLTCGGASSYCLQHHKQAGRSHSDISDVIFVPCQGAVLGSLQHAASMLWYAEGATVADCAHLKNAIRVPRKSRAAEEGPSSSKANFSSFDSAPPGRHSMHCPVTSWSMRQQRIHHPHS